MPDGPTIDDFLAYLPTHAYIFTPTATFWKAEGVNACVQPVVLTVKGEPVLVKNKKGEMVPKTVAPTVYLDWTRPVHHMIWMPGEPTLIRDRIMIDGGWLKRKKLVTYNSYRPPAVAPGNPKDVAPWVNLIKKIYPNDWAHIVAFLAHRVQHPGDKINHALLLGGAPGIGKDSLLSPIKYAVGPWNFHEVSPQQVTGRFNGFLKSTVLRISEARDLGDVNRYGFHEHMKAYTAAPPDVLRVDEKNTPEHLTWNCCGVIYTTNHLYDGIYLPPDDRRHYVAWSDLTSDAFTKDEFNDLYAWYAAGGERNVAAYLLTYDLSKFDPKRPPVKTPAFWSVVDSGRAPEEGELADALDKLGDPEAVTLADVIRVSGMEFSDWLNDRKNRRTIPHRFDAVRYMPVRNDDAASGLWNIGGVRQAIYAQKNLTPSERRAAAAAVKTAGDEKAAKDAAEFANRVAKSQKVQPLRGVTPPPRGKRCS
jgi:hypothetical protein